MGGNGGGRFTGPSARKIKQFILFWNPVLWMVPGSFVYLSTVFIQQSANTW
jgi:hypothetical protein